MRFFFWQSFLGQSNRAPRKCPASMQGDGGAGSAVQSNLPTRSVTWKLGGEIAAKTVAGYPTSPPIFEHVLPATIRGQPRSVRFTLRWIWTSSTALAPAAAPPAPRELGRGMRRRKKRKRYSSSDEEEPAPKRRGRGGRRRQEDSDSDSVESEGYAPTRNPKRMTARQRAMLNPQNAGGAAASLVFLPIKAKADKRMTEAQLLKKSETARKRRLALIKQTEEAKLEVVERLLMKTGSRESRKKRLKEKRKAAWLAQVQAKPKIPESTLFRSRVVTQGDDRVVETTISFPVGKPMPMCLFGGVTDGSSPPRPTVASRPVCANETCGRPKRFSCARNGLPVCQNRDCYRVVSTHTKC